MTILLLGSGRTILQAKKCIDNYLVGSNYEDILIKHFNDLKSMERNSECFEIMIIEPTGKQLNETCKEDFELLSERIRANNASTVIITDKNNCPVELFRLHVIDRILTETIESGLQKVLDNYFEGYYAKNNLFHYNVYKSQRIINKNQILFLQSDGKRVIIYTKRGQDTFYGKLSDCIKQPCMKHFVFIHQSYLINTFYIDEIRNGKVYIDKWELPISRKYSCNVKTLISKCYHSTIING